MPGRADAAAEQRTGGGRVMTRLNLRRYLSESTQEISRLVIVVMFLGFIFMVGCVAALILTWPRS